MPTSSPRRVLPCLFTSDMRATLDFYTRVLGFTQTGYFPIASDPVQTEVRRDEAAFIFFTDLPHFQGETPACSGIFFVFPENIDSLADEIRDQVEILWGPEEALGMRHFAIRDPNGYTLAFAERSR